MQQENERYVVYKHTNTINGKMYVGQTCLKPEDRWENGGKGYECYSVTPKGNKKPTRFWGAICKYGWENFEHKVLIRGLTKEQADRWERRLIKTWNLTDKRYGYNLRDGGSRGKHSEESKRKMSESRKDGIQSGSIKVRTGFKNSEETRKRISQARLGIEPWNKGKTGVYSEEVLNKMSETRKRKIASGEIEVRRGFKHSEEIKQKLSKNHADVNGKNNPMYGVHRYGLDAPTKVKVVRLSDNKIYDLVKFCAEDNNLSVGKITAHCKNRLKTKPQEFMYYIDWIKQQKDES